MGVPAFKHKGVSKKGKGGFSSEDILAEVFYNVNYVNVNYSVKNSTVDCKYLLFLQDFFFRLKPKQYKKYQYFRLLKKISGNS